MAIAELSGKIQTVLGLIDPDEMGVTLSHEHLVCDGSYWFEEPSMATDKDMAHPSRLHGDPLVDSLPLVSKPGRSASV